MNQTETTNTMLSLIRCFLTGECFDGELSGEQREGVYDLAARHDVAHLIGIVLERSTALEKDDPFVRAKWRAVYRYVKQDVERQRIYELFETEQIPYIPLKGNVIAQLYAEPWQRTSCDIDILVQEKDLERAVNALEHSLEYRFRKKSEHDVSLMTPGGVHLELHYDLHEQEMSVTGVWECAGPVCAESMQFALAPEEFLLHHIAHMAKHFKYGGCGVRPFLDLQIIAQKMPYNKDELNALLEERGLNRFAEMAFGLTALWFGNGEVTPILTAAAEYIMPAGTYGSLKNRVAVGQLNRGDKAHYFLSRLFLSRKTLEYPYPMLKKHGWLLPFCQIHRWGKLLADGKWGQITRELKTNSTLDDEYKGGVAQLMDLLGL